MTREASEIPELAIVRARSDAGPYRRDDLLSLAFTAPLRGRLVAHEPRDAGVDGDAQSARFPEAFEVEVVRTAGPYASDAILALSFIDPSFVTIRPVAGRAAAAEPGVAGTTPPGDRDASPVGGDRRDATRRRADETTVPGAPAPHREPAEPFGGGRETFAAASAPSPSAFAPRSDAGASAGRSPGGDTADRRGYPAAVTSPIVPPELRPSAPAPGRSEGDEFAPASPGRPAMRGAIDHGAETSEGRLDEEHPSSPDARSDDDGPPPRHHPEAAASGEPAHSSLASAMRLASDGDARPSAVTSRPAVAFGQRATRATPELGGATHHDAAAAPSTSGAPSTISSAGFVHAYGTLDRARAAVAASYAAERSSVVPALTLRSVWTVERTARFVQLVDKLFTVDRLGWYRHALVVRMLLPETVGCADSNVGRIVQSELDALRAASTVVLGRPLLAAFMPNFAVSAQWLASLESPAEARATGALRDAIACYGSADLDSQPCDAERVAVVRLPRQSLEPSAAASIEALVSMLIPHLTTSDAVSASLGAYRSSMIELFGQMADVSEAVRLRTMTQPSHLLDDRLWQAVAALGSSYSAPAPG